MYIIICIVRYVYIVRDSLDRAPALRQFDVAHCCQFVATGSPRPPRPPTLIHPTSSSVRNLRGTPFVLILQYVSSTEIADHAATPDRNVSPSRRPK
ncbi:unnamed protein product [Leptosia nina]|uniref:Uncharacterized protein n=1 Tax=Leptosia nina TaxID=320188 RepID=A0AAV1JAV0_9NEOP